MIVVDTGVLYASADADDAHHRACALLLERHPGPLARQTGSGGGARDRRSERKKFIREEHI